MALYGKNCRSCSHFRDGVCMKDEQFYTCYDDWYNNDSAHVFIKDPDTFICNNFTDTDKNVMLMLNREQADDLYWILCKLRKDGKWAEYEVPNYTTEQRDELEADDIERGKFYYLDNWFSFREKLTDEIIRELELKGVNLTCTEDFWNGI